MSNLQRLANGAIVMCCGGKGCPTLRLNEETVEITDDHGSMISISKDEAELIKVALDQAKTTGLSERLSDL
jgi:hypothetical protein